MRGWVSGKTCMPALTTAQNCWSSFPKPDHPENHFVFDHTKWIFYAADCYTWLGDDQPGEERAREIIAYHTQPDGSSNAPMRSAIAHTDLPVIRAKHGGLDQAVYHGLTASATSADRSVLAIPFGRP